VLRRRLDLGPPDTWVLAVIEPYRNIDRDVTDLVTDALLEPSFYAIRVVKWY
jgi:hypothetical protein